MIAILITILAFLLSALLIFNKEPQEQVKKKAKKQPPRQRLFFVKDITAYVDCYYLRIDVLFLNDDYRRFDYCYKGKEKGRLFDTRTRMKITDEMTEKYLIDIGAYFDSCPKSDLKFKGYFETN